jgi:Ca-activated chloride channel family protein
MDPVQDYYAILGSPSNASDEDLRLAYRAAARRFHPDVNKAPGAAIIFRDINSAYEILSDRQRRSEYDRLLAARGWAHPSLQLTTLYSRHFLRRMSEPQLLYTLVRIQPLLEVNLTSDAPLNLCLVLDRSTSMKGGRLQHLKSAVHRIVDECHEMDILSIVSFSDGAEVLVPAQHPADVRNIKALVSTMRPDGATAILQGLRAGLAQVERHRDPKYVNHLILITDGRTYGDEEECLRLAREAHERGVGISGMGIGEDWNDDFLDSLASGTGGSSTYVISPDTVSRFLHERIRSLAAAYAERAHLITAPATNVDLNSATRLAPNAMTLTVNPQPIPLGSISGVSPTILLLQFHILTDNTPEGEFFVGRVDVSADVLGATQRSERIVEDITVTISDEEVGEEPPAELLEALSKLVLYRLHDRAREAIQQGDIAEATRKLEALATRLFESGQEELAQAALQEAQIVSQTQSLSDEGTKRLKYGTRALLPFLGDQ